MIAGGNHVRTGVSQLARSAGRNPVPARAVFAVDDHEVGVELGLQVRKHTFECAAARRAVDVADRQNVDDGAESIEPGTVAERRTVGSTWRSRPRASRE